MSSIFDNFWFIAIVGLTVVLMPFWTAALVAWRSKHSIPRSGTFVFVCAVFVYGLASLLGLMAPILELFNIFIGTNNPGWLGDVSFSLWHYGVYLFLFIVAAVSVYVPLRLARSWAALVAAWL